MLLPSATGSGSRNASSTTDGMYLSLSSHKPGADFPRYPYPIFEQLPTSGRIGLFTLSAVVMALSTSTLQWLHGRINGFGVPVRAQSRPGDIKRQEGL